MLRPTQHRLLNTKPEHWHKNVGNRRQVFFCTYGPLNLVISIYKRFLWLFLSENKNWKTKKKYGYKNSKDRRHIKKSSWEAAFLCPRSGLVFGGRGQKDINTLKGGVCIEQTLNFNYKLPSGTRNCFIKLCNHEEMISIYFK